MIKEKDLPNGWKIVLLPEVIFFQEGPGVRNSQFTKRGIKLINVRNLVDNQLILDNTETYISEEEAITRYKHFLVDEGDLIIASSGIQMDYFHKKIAFAKKEHLPLCMNTSTIRFKTLDNKKLDIRYFRYFLMTPYFIQQVQFYITGSAQLNFGPSHLKKMRVILPPLKTQKQIVSILEKAEKAKKIRKEADELAEDYLNSVFLEVFGNPLTNDKKWHVEPLKKFGLIKTGNTPSRKREEYYGDYIEWIKSDNINTPYTFLTKSEEMLSKDGVKIGRIVPKGSVLVTCIAGSLSCIGNVAIADRDVAFNQQINAIVPNKEVNKYFLYYLILNTKKKIQKSSTQSMKGMVSKSVFESIEYILPPIELQNKFAKIVEEVEKLKQYQKESKEKIDNLFNALMQKAFKGELVV